MFLHSCKTVLKSTGRTEAARKNGTREFKMASMKMAVPPLRDTQFFKMTITGVFEHFKCFNFETSFLKNENLLK